VAQRPSLTRNALILSTFFFLTSNFASAVDPALLELGSPEAQSILGINIDEVKASPLGHYLLGRMQNEDPKLQKFIAATGFDPRRDVREVVVISNSASSHTWLVLARGVYDVQRVLEAARAQRLQVSSYKGVDIIELPAGEASKSGHASNRGWVAFLDGSLVAVGDSESVKQAIDRRGRGNGVQAPIAAKAQELSARYHAWLASSVPADQLSQLASQGGSPVRADLSQTIDQIAGGVRFGQMVEFGGEAVTRSDQDATALADVLRFLSKMVQPQKGTPHAALVTTLLQNLQLRTEGPVVQVSGSISSEDLQKLIETNRKRPRKQVGG